MAIQLNYTDPGTNQNTNSSYWFAEIATFDRRNGLCSWEMRAYNSLADMNAKKNYFSYKAIAATFAQLGITLASTLNQCNAAVDTYALTWKDPLTNQIFFAGGTIV